MTQCSEELGQAVRLEKWAKNYSDVLRRVVLQCRPAHTGRMEVSQKGET